MFWGADGFFETLVFVWSCWMRGRLGGGKTLLAVAVAGELVKRGVCKGVMANFPVRLPRPKSGMLYDCAVIIDEMWQVADARDYQSNERRFGGFARKIRSFWLYPSVFPPDVRLRAFFAERVIQLPFLPGSPWVYRWQFDLGYAEQGGRFLLVNPQQYFGTYPSDWIPDEDASGFLAAWEKTVAFQKAQQKRVYR